MNEQLEFLISQYADGTLDASASAALEAQLAGDPEARATLESHRRLIGMLRDMPIPEIAGDRLAARISSAVAAAPQPGDIEEAPTSYRLFTSRAAWGVMGLAASLLIVAGVLLSILAGGHARHGNHHAGPVAVGKPINNVIGPRAEVALGPAMMAVSIGPGKGLATGGLDKYATESHPSSVLVASGAPGGNDAVEQMPF